MATSVAEIMNRELFTLRPEETVEDALGYVLALGVGGAPVVDAAGALLGMVSLRDLLADRQGRCVGDRMSLVVGTIPATSTIAEAGRVLGESGHHRLVVETDGQPVGVVSAIDIVRGLLGMPAPHPATFPHYDPDTGVLWSDDSVLELERTRSAPAAAGVFAILRGGAGARETVVWVEAAADVRRRLCDLVSLPQEQTPMLRKILAYRELRFRAAAVIDSSERERLVSKLVAQVRTSFTLAR